MNRHTCLFRVTFMFCHIQVVAIEFKTQVFTVFVLFCFKFWIHPRVNLTF